MHGQVYSALVASCITDLKQYVFINIVNYQSLMDPISRTNQGDDNIIKGNKRPARPLCSADVF